MTVISISLPDPLLEQADALIKARGYAGRSEIIRAALRDYVAREQAEPSKEGARSATLTIVYPEGQERKVSDIRHDFSELVKSMMHSHTTSDCVEVFLLQGKASRIREFNARLRGFRDAKLVQTVYTDTPEEGAGHRH